MFVTDLKRHKRCPLGENHRDKIRNKFISERISTLSGKAI